MKTQTQNLSHKLLAVIMTLSMSLTAISMVIYAVADDQSLPFSDVGLNDWFFEQVQHVFEEGIMTGTDNETFSPHLNVTNAMFVQILYNHAGRPEVMGLITRFTDVASDVWYHDAVVWAVHQRIIDDRFGLFGPNVYITRSSLVIMLNAYANAMDLELPATRNSAVFVDDADIRNYAKEAIDRFFRAMIINGRPDGRFDPHANTTRAELAAMLSGFVLYSENAVNGYDYYDYAVPEYGVYNYDYDVPLYGIPCDEPINMPDYGFFYDDYVTPEYGIFDEQDHDVVVPPYGFAAPMYGIFVPPPPPPSMPMGAYGIPWLPFENFEDEEE